MGLQKFIEKLCQKYAYAVAIRPAGLDVPFSIKYATNNAWYADPFVCTYEGKSYVFVELLNSYHLYGEIAVAPISDGVIGEFKVVISENFHMSFPNVFFWRGDWYMLPETNMSRQVRLYRATAFPYRWELSDILMEDVQLVDYALYPAESGFYVVANDIKVEKDAFNRCFYFDVDQKTFTEFLPRGNWCQIRPGGTFYQHNGKWRHAMQDGILAYGDFLHIYEVDEFTREVFNEREICQVKVDDLTYKNGNNKLEHIHTYNRNELYEVVDVQYKRIYPNKFFMHQWHQILKHKSKENGKRGMGKNEGNDFT